MKIRILSSDHHLIFCKPLTFRVQWSTTGAEIWVQKDVKILKMIKLQHFRALEYITTYLKNAGIKDPDNYELVSEKEIPENEIDHVFRKYHDFRKRTNRNGLHQTRKRPGQSLFDMET